MWSCLVAYVKHFKHRRVRHICKMEKLEIRAVIKYFCKKGMPPKEIHAVDRSKVVLLFVDYLCFLCLVF